MIEEQQSKFSPKEFLQRRRPEKFSDSVVTEVGVLERPVLEHFLAKLNTRNQELQLALLPKSVEPFPSPVI
ncbi:hypothetical protein [Vibrio sp. OPT18]|uniref:hypothetical protein n=1 Tax=Vibrio sp. OPT18 TaxID=2778641 RepID=UPI001881A67D|nr:hypothetical protein [Vibrio sp. OPT18]MBE8574210.1 hypothetical protein [Vibrio sp. OPT18]